MRGAFGKPTGMVARVDIGDVIVSVRAKENMKNHVLESLRRAKYKFPGRQVIICPVARDHRHRVVAVASCG
jgi:large subunit ribosomal protein L10e